MIDFLIQATGSNFILMHPETQAADNFFETLKEDQATRPGPPLYTFFGGALVVELRYLNDFLNDLEDNQNFTFATFFEYHPHEVKRCSI